MFLSGAMAQRALDPAQGRTLDVREAVAQRALDPAPPFVGLGYSGTDP